MANLTQALSSNLGLPPNSFVYKILSTSPRLDPLANQQTDHLAIISSDDCLRFVDPVTLDILPDGAIKNVNESVTCLERVDDAASTIIATAGRDGLVKLWDRRSRRNAMIIESSNKLISSLVCSSPRNFIAAGIENPNDGPNVSPVYIWDQRNPQIPKLELVESHTDTVTDLQLHPNLPALLLSSSTDGLVNIFDTRKPDEEDALHQVINHRSAVARAGFMFPGTDIFAMGTNETLSFYALQSQQEDKEEPAPKVFGDVRDAMGCEYLAKMHWVGDGAYIAAGKHSENYFDLIPIQKNSLDVPLQYGYDLEKRIRLAGAHGEEIVRDVFTDVHSETTYTCGEDGMLRAWKMSNDEAMDIDEGTDVTQNKAKDRKEKRKERKQKRKGGEEDKKARYKPY